MAIEFLHKLVYFDFETGQTVEREMTAEELAIIEEAETTDETHYPN